MNPDDFVLVAPTPSKMLVLLTPSDQHLRTNPEDFSNAANRPPAKMLVFLTPLAARAQIAMREMSYFMFRLNLNTMT